MDSTRLRAPVTHRFKPVGACIYCGATQGRLTEEHIVPKGLGGTLVLPDSSCDPCAKLTSQFEMKVLRGFLDRGRQSLGIKGRKSHRRSATESIKQTFIRADNSLVEHDLPWDQSVKVMHLPVLTLPGFLNPKFPPDPSAEGIEVSAMDTLTMGLGKGEIVREHASVGMQFQDRMDICSFVRMLAKIAHGYQVAVHGAFPIEQSPLVPIILGKRWDARNWIGCTEQDPLPSDRQCLHLLQDVPLTGGDGSSASMIRIKLFADYPSPTYALAARLQA